MSELIEKRIVDMEFNNENFEKNITQSMKTLDTLKDKLNFNKSSASLEKLYTLSEKVDFSKLSNAVNQVAYHFTALEVAGITVLSNIVNQAFNAGKRIVSALTIDPVRTGLSEYETKINSIQTILANTKDEGKSLEDVNAALDELNVYADKTIYNFTEMTRNIGTFTSAGVKLETATSAIQGLANVAAVSGANAEQASRAMYQLSQALATGTVRLMDWRSMENASMGGEAFQKIILDTARDHGVAVDALIKKYGSFRDSLQAGWLKADLMTEALAKTTKSGAAEYLAKLTGIDADLISRTQQLVDANKDGTASYDELVKKLASTGKITEDRAREILDFADTAENAATKVKTFTQLWDTLKEAAQSGWTSTWQIIIGDFEEAKELLTSISDSVGAYLTQMANARNTLLQGWKGSGSLEYLASISGLNKELIVEASKLIEANQNGAISYEELAKATGWTEEKLKEFISTNKEGVITYEELAEAIAATNAVTKEQAKELISNKDLDGRRVLIEALKNVIISITSVLKTVGSALKTVFPGITSTRLYELTEQFRDFTKTLNPSEATLTKISDTSLRVAKILRTAFDILGKVGSNLRLLFLALKKEAKNVFPEATIKNAYEKMTEVLDFIAEKLKKVSDNFKLSADSISKFRRIFNGVFSVFRIAIDIVSGFIDILGKLFPMLSGAPGSIGSGFLSLAANIGDAFTRMREYIQETGVLQMFFNGLSFAIDKLKDGFKALISSMRDSEYVKNLAEMIGDFTKSIITFIDSLAKSLDGILGGGGMSFMSILTAIFTGKLISSLSRIGDMFDMVGDALESIQRLVMADTIKQIGIAIAILAGSMLLVSFIPADKLLTSTGAIVVALASIMGALQSMSSIGKGGIKGLISSLELLEMAQLLQGIATSVAILAAAMILISLIPTDKLMTSLGVLLVIMSVIPFIADSIASSDVKGAYRAMMSLIGFAIAVSILAGALKSISDMDWESLKKGMFGVVGLIAALTAMIKITGSIRNGRRTAKVLNSLIPVALSLVILTKILKVIGDMPIENIRIGMLGIAALLSAMGLTMYGLSLIPNSKKASSAAVSLIPIALALSIVVKALKELGTVNYDELTTGMKAMALLLLAMVGVLAVVSVIKNAEMAALAMLAMASGIFVLAKAFKTIGEMKLADIGKSLGAIIALLAILAVSAVVVSTLVAPFATLSAVLLSFGVAISMVGVGFALFATGLATMAAIGPGAAEALKLMALVIIEMIPEIAIALARGFVDFVKEVFKGSAELIEAFVQLLSDLLTTIDNHLPEFIDKGASIIVNFLNGIAEHMPEVIDAAWNLVTSFFNAIGEKTGISAWLEEVGIWFENLKESIKQKWEDFKSIGANIIAGIKQGLEDAWNGLKGWFSGLWDRITSSAETAYDIHSPSKVFAEIGGYCMKGLAAGFNEYAGVVDQASKSIYSRSITTAENMGSKFSDIFNSEYNPKITPVVNSREAYLPDLGMAGNINLMLTAPAKSIAETMMEAQYQMDLRNSEVMSAVKDLQEQIGKYVSVDNRDISLYVDSRKLASTIATPMNRELSVIARRGVGV